VPAGLPDSHVFQLVRPADPAGLAMWDTSQDDRGLTVRDHRIGNYIIQPIGLPTGLFGVRTCWGTDRCALYFASLKPAGGTVVAPVPPPMEIEIRAGADGCQSVIAILDWQPPAWHEPDMIVQVCARLATQWEVWARVVPDEGGTRGSAGVSFRLLLDRSGGCRDAEPAIQPGPNVTVVP
jgi:hypothetical protein